MQCGGVMSKNKLITACAGAGKTTFLIKRALEEKGQILILTYTLANEESIKEKFLELNKYIPSNITISTWFAFLLRHGIKPYQSSVDDLLINKHIRGLHFTTKPSGVKYITKLKHNVEFSELEEFERHYFSKDFKIFSDKLAKLVFRCNQKSNGAVIKRLASIYTHIYVDEVQDLAGYDLEIIKLLSNSLINMLLVGDPRQVTYLTHHSKKHQKYKDGKIKDFLQKDIKKNSYEYDEEILNASHRCNQKICDLASKLYPQHTVMKACKCCINENDLNQGVFAIRISDVAEYMKIFPSIQLRWDKRTKVDINEPTYNFGESKGLTFNRVLIYPTQKMKNWLNNNTTKLENSTRAKFYVAITRAKLSVGIIAKNDENFPLPFYKV